jgi:hypothetical protein
MKTPDSASASAQEIIEYLEDMYQDHSVQLGAMSVWLFLLVHERDELLMERSALSRANSIDIDKCKPGAIK